MKINGKLVLSVILPIPVLIIAYIFIFTFTANGKIVDKYTGKPLVGLKIPLTLRTIATDKQGKFSISFARKGFCFKVSKKDYETTPASIPSNKPLIIKLRPTTLSGKVIDAYTNQPIGEAVITLGKQKVKSDYKGSYKLSNVPEKINLVTQAPDKKYEALETSISGTANKDLRVCLNPREANAYEYSLIEHGQYEDSYETMHSDSKKLVSKNQYVKYRRQTERELKDLGAGNYEIKTGNLKMLKSWTNNDVKKTYKNVAEVQTTIEVVTGLGKIPVPMVGHLVKDNGIWAWFLTQEQMNDAKKL